LGEQHDVAEERLVRESDAAIGLLLKIRAGLRQKPVSRLLEQVEHVHVREFFPVELRV
jgi:hypothetical protein